jgi:hypothetical protein
VLGLTTARESLDDDHAATAAWAQLRQSAGLIGFGGGIDIVLRWALRHGEQLASTSDIGSAVFAVGEQPVVTDAMQALGQKEGRFQADFKLITSAPATPADPVLTPRAPDLAEAMPATPADPSSLVSDPADFMRKVLATWADALSMPMRAAEARNARPDRLVNASLEHSRLQFGDRRPQVI